MQIVLIFATMDRESYLRSLPYLHPSSWPAPSASHAYGGSYVRKLILSGHGASIEPSSSQPGTFLGPAFFLTDTSASLTAAAAVTEGGAHIPAIEDDPALCPFETSVLVPKSIAGVSPGASSASTAFASSQSPVGTTPAAAAVGKATPAATSASSAMASTSTGRLSDTPKQSDAQSAPEPILYFRFGGNGTYCVNYSHIHSITVVEKGSNLVANKKAAEAEGSQDDEAGSQGVGIPPSIVISFGTCSFRIFRLATPMSDPGSTDEDTNEEQLKNLRLTVSELTASLRAAGSFVPPPFPSTDKDASVDTQLSDRASLEEGGQIDGGIGLESSGATCSEGKGQSQATDGDTNTVQMSEDGKNRSQASQQSHTTEEDTQQRSAFAKEDDDNDTEAVSKRRRTAYKQSVAAIDSIGAIADPISNNVDTGARRRVGSGAVVQKQLSSLMKVAATALAVSYEEASIGTESSSEDRVDKIATVLDEAVCEFIPIHTRVKQQRGGVLSSLSMSSPPPAKRPGSLESTASAAAGTTGDDDLARDADELRDIARKMIDEYREAIAAKHRTEIFLSR